MIQTPYYTYHDQPIKRIYIKTYIKFLKSIEKYSDSKKKYLIKCLIRSYCHIFLIEYNYSILETYYMIKASGFNFDNLGFDDQFILDFISNYELKEKRNKHYEIETYFEWNYRKLNLDMNKKEIERYKRKIINKHINEKKLAYSNQIIANLYDDNRDMFMRDIIEKLQGKIKDKRTINRALKANNIVMKKKSKAFLLIESRINDVLNELKGQRITNKLVSSKIGVSLITYKRWKWYQKNTFPAVILNIKGGNV